MKKLNSLIYMFIGLLLLVGCKHDEVIRISPTGEFAVNFDFPEGEITAPSKLILVNRSRFAEKFLWEFPEGKTLDKSGLNAVATSNKIVPDTIVYDLPGTYTVSLTAWQGDKFEKISKEIQVSKMKPQIVLPESIGIEIEYEFSARVFSYPGVPVTYTWDFDEPGLTSTEAKPKVTFTREGLHTVNVKVNDGEEILETTIVILVKGELSKALYFTDAVTNKVYKYSLLQDESERVIEQLSVTTGTNPFGLKVYNGRIYITEAGFLHKFPSGTQSAIWNGDGSVYTVNLEGKDRALITENKQLYTASGTGYQLDPFNLDIDNGNIYFNIRNNGIKLAAITARNLEYPGNYISTAIGDNGGTSVFSWLDGAVRIVKNEIWLSKGSSAGKYIFVYDKGTKVFKRKITLEYAVKNFVVDTINNKLYFACNFPATAAGIYKSNLDGAGATLIDNLAGFSTQGGDNERTHVTGMALDVRPNDPTGGHLYIGFRHNDTVRDNVAPADANTVFVNASEKNKSGIYRYELSGSNTKTFLIPGYAPYGLDIDHTLR